VTCTRSFDQWALGNVSPSRRLGESWAGQVWSRGRCGWRAFGEVLLHARLKFPEWRDGRHDEAIQRGEKKWWIYVKMTHWQYYSTVVRSRPACDKQIVDGTFYIAAMVLNYVNAGRAGSL
jgi:hypothetical protein